MEAETERGKVRNKKMNNKLKTFKMMTVSLLINANILTPISRETYPALPFLGQFSRSSSLGFSGILTNRELSNFYHSI